MENQQNQTQRIVVVSQKSLGLSVVLAFIFGPLGLLYSSVAGGLIMMVISAIVAVVTLGFGLLITWPICIVWAIIATNNYNKSLVN